MDAYRAIISKRDRREYDSARPIEDEAVHRILQAGRMAGSSSNKQPCRFVVVSKDHSVLDKLAPAGRGTAPMLRAPLVVIIVLTPGGGPFDVGRAAQNMMVAAWADGIISCPQGLQEQELARSVLGVPADHTVGMGVAFGYPESGSPASRSQGRLEMDEIVHWERW